VLVIGSANSSNTARLVDIARDAGAAAWRVDGPDELSSCDFAGIKRLGLTAGASTPEAIVVDIAARLGRI
jgi:4-hydroxy-3-methylbut-2-enyl diphosphate reductase